MKPKMMSNDVNNPVIKKFLFYLLISFLFFVNRTYSDYLQQNINKIPKSFKVSFESAEELLRIGDYQDAIRKIQKALRLAEDFNYEEGKILCNMRLGLLYWNTGMLAESTNFYEEALSLAKKIDAISYEEECSKTLEIFRYYSAGKDFRSSGNYEKSIENFGNAVQIAREIGSKAHELKCLRQLSIGYWDSNDYKNFYELNLKALRLALLLNNKREEFRCLNNIGIYQRKAGNYSKALSRYEEAFRVVREMNSKKEESVILSNIGNIYKDIGSYERSLEYLFRALWIDRQVGNNTEIAIDLLNIGETYRTRGYLRQSDEDYKRALNNYNDCLVLIEKNHIVYADMNLINIIKVRVLNNLGVVHLNLKNCNKSLEFFIRGYDKAFEIYDLEALSMISCNMGATYFGKQDYSRAIKQYNQAVVFADKTKASNVLWEAYFGLGRFYEKIEDFQKAIENYERSIDEIDNIRSRIVIDSFKAGFARDKLHVYESLINILFKADEKSSHIKGKIFDIIERAKARAFLESVGESQYKIKERLSPAVRKRENEITDTISTIMYQLSDVNISEKRRKELQNDYHQAENEYMLLISKMRTEIPEVANMLLPEPCHLDQIQNRLLDEKTAVVEYFLGEKHSYLLVVEKYNSSIYLLPSRTEIKRSVKGLIKELSDPPQGFYRGFLGSYRLYKELLSPIEDLLPEAIEHLIVVPDGILYFLPFEALLTRLDKKIAGNSFLINKYRISYAPSCSSLLFLKKKETKKNHKKSLLAIGNPDYSFREDELNVERSPSYILKEIYNDQGYDFTSLPYSNDEIRKIARLFPKSQKDVFLGADAREGMIKKTSLEDYQIIHFACHSLLNERFPFRSALVLAFGRDSEEDGLLLVREIYNLRLSADMIVLSACQTGKGTLENIEGVLGLPRIFFYCGARSVVSSLWKINDKSTTKLMSYFYKSLSEGKDKSQALRLAKLKMLKSRFSHPFYWASFVLYGDSSAIEKLN